MLIDFTYQNPTAIHFGRTAMEHLVPEIRKYGTNILLIYGKNSIKRSGLYDEITRTLTYENKRIFELSGINSNPRWSQVMEGVRIARENTIDLILAVGGGSVIDCAKAISASVYAPGDPWDLYWLHHEPLRHKVIPVGTILTMVGTGSEMNSGSVITHEEQKLKLSSTFPLALMSPRFSILNPELTFTVPKYQMVSGIFDIFSHLLEQYLSGEDDCTTDYLIEGVMRSLIHSARQALVNPLDYEARSNIMWCATMGLNRILGVSKTQDWQTHKIEHQLGAYTDCAHGIGLAIITPSCLRHMLSYALPRLVRFAENVWNITLESITATSDTTDTDRTIALEGINRLENFIRELGIPSTLREVGATAEMLPQIADSTILASSYHTPTHAEVLQILQNCY